MVFYGASGHAKVVIEAWLASGGTVTAVCDDNESIKRLLSYNVSGKYDRNRYPDADVFISIGSNSIRQKLASTLAGKFGTVVHPSAVISPTCTIGEGTVVMAGVIINAAAAVGRHVIVNTCASVDHDCVLGDYTHISPNATLCGDVTVGEGTQVGAGATVIPGVSVGKWVVIGAGSVVTRDVPDGAVVMGVPGKVVRQLTPMTIGVACVRFL